MPKKPLAWLAASVAVGLVAALWTVLGVVWAAAADRAAVIEGQAVHTERLDDHEQRLRRIETTTTEIGADVRWIRHTLERNNRQP